MAVPELPDPLEPPPEKPDDPPPRPAGKAAQWQAAGSKAKASGKGTALIVTVLLFVGVAGALVALLAFIPRAKVDPYVVSIPVIAYGNDTIPPNPWALEDAELVTGCFPKDAQNTRHNNQARGPFVQKLKYVRELADRWHEDHPGEKFDPDRAFILHVVAHAATDEKGAVYVLPSDADPTDSSTWVKVEEILKAMDECKA